MRYADDAEELFLPVSCAEYFSLGQTIGTTSAALVEAGATGSRSCALFCALPASKTVALGSNGKGEQIAHSRAKNQRYSKPSHLVAKMSAATVNRRVASSNLARGANSLAFKRL